MKGQIADKLNTEERCELKDEDFGIPETREFPMPDAPHVERRVREAVAEGASIIDVGGYSSRPGADEVSPGEEWRRVKLGVGAVRRLAPGMAVSVDTFRSEVAARAIERFGPLIINDISAGELDPAMPAVAAIIIRRPLWLMLTAVRESGMRNVRMRRLRDGKF